MTAPQTRIVQPVPPEFFAQMFEGGWRRIERLYGARTDVLIKWLHLCGFVKIGRNWTYGGQPIRAHRIIAKAVNDNTPKARAA